METVMLSFLTGIAIGGIYFAGLWETVRRLPDAPMPFRTVASSLAVRMTLALGGFYLVSQGQWERMAAAMAGFLLMRGILLRTVGRTAKPLMGGAPDGSCGH